MWNLNSLATIAFAQLGQLLAGSVAAALVTAALTFKLAFTHEDSPELMSGIVKAMADTDVGISLVTRARIVFGGLVLALFYTVTAGFWNGKRPNR
jgi:ethanolaminephosphotransferase